MLDSDFGLSRDARGQLYEALTYRRQKPIPEPRKGLSPWAWAKIVGLSLIAWLVVWAGLTALFSF